MALKAKRISRRSADESITDKQDELTQATSRVMAFYQANRRSIILGGGATLLIIVATLAITSNLESRREARSEIFSSAVSASLVPVEATPPDTAAPEGDQAGSGTAAVKPEPAPAPAPVAAADGKLPVSFPSDTARAEFATKEYQKFLAEYGNGGALSAMAKAALASLSLAQGKADEAVKQYKELLAGSDVADAQLRFFVLDGLAAAQVAAGDLPGADKSYQDIAALQGGSLGDYAAYKRGQLAEAQGQKDEARQTYRAALEKFPGGPYQDEIQKRLDLL